MQKAVASNVHCYALFLASSGLQVRLAPPRTCLGADIMEGQGVGATSGCLRRRARLAEMRLDMGELDAAEALFRAILGYVETAQVGVRQAGRGCGARRVAAEAACRAGVHVFEET